MAETRVALPEDFDFETYINSYEGKKKRKERKNTNFLTDNTEYSSFLYLGHTRIARSIFIAKHCDALAIEAYKTALNDIKENTANVSKYNTVLERLNAVLRSQGQPTLPIDQDWITKTQNQNKTTMDSLDNELKAAKASLVKENIRVRIYKYICV